MLETGSSYCKIESLLVVIRKRDQSVNQSAHKGIATANTIHNVGDVVAGSKIHFGTII